MQIYSIILCFWNLEIYVIIVEWLMTHSLFPFPAPFLHPILRFSELGHVHNLDNSKFIF